MSNTLPSASSCAYSAPMGRAQTVRTSVTRVTELLVDPIVEHGPDDVIVEEPLSIRLDGHLVSSTMRTPGHDVELAVGLCFTDGLLAGAPVVGVRFVPTDDLADDAGDSSARSDQPITSNLVDVDTGGRAPVPSPRLGNVSSSCGWCGSDQIDDLCLRLHPLVETTPFDLATLASVPALVAHHQHLFASTGAAHCAAVFDRSGQVVMAREDVGRHNAVDKVVGGLVLEGGRLPATGLGLFVSGRASIEMVQKAWAAGFGTLLAVSAPTSLAVEAARRARMTLVGFARGDVLNVYSTCESWHSDNVRNDVP